VNRRNKLNYPDQDDAVNIAGWVFADLLLSLSVIFLTSISFAAPSSTGDSRIPAQTSEQALKVKDSSNGLISPNAQGFNLYYTSFSKSKIESDLRAYFARENFSPESNVIYAQIIGGFNSMEEGSEMGTMRALEFSISLKRANIRAFEGANFDLATSESLNPNQVALRLSFAPPVQFGK
jgi:hypothetical protein